MPQRRSSTEGPSASAFEYLNGPGQLSLRLGVCDVNVTARVARALPPLRYDVAVLTERVDRCAGKDKMEGDLKEIRDTLTWQSTKNLCSTFDFEQGSRDCFCQAPACHSSLSNLGIGNSTMSNHVAACSYSRCTALRHSKLQSHMGKALIASCIWDRAVTYTCCRTSLCARIESMQFHNGLGGVLAST